MSGSSSTELCHPQDMNAMNLCKLKKLNYTLPWDILFWANVKAALHVLHFLEKIALLKNKSKNNSKMLDEMKSMKMKSIETILHYYYGPIFGCAIYFNTYEHSLSLLKTEESRWNSLVCSHHIRIIIIRRFWLVVSVYMLLVITCKLRIY